MMLKRLVDLALFGAFVLIVVLGSAPTAKSDPFVHDAAMVCRLLDANSSPAGFAAISYDMLYEGLDKDTASATIAYAVTEVCPEYADDLSYAVSVIESRGFVA
jgi:hypothetical protein